MMGQEDVLDFIEKSDWIVSARQISEAIGKEVYSVSHSLSKLMKYKEVNFLEVDRNQADLLIDDYKVHKRMRFFFSIKVSKTQMARDLKAFLRSKLAQAKTSKEELEE